MAEVTFYHQERVDGGHRSGLDVDGESALQRFVPGGEDSNPALVWYVDVVFTTDAPPPTQEEALVWIEQHEPDVAEALQAAAESLSCGIDTDYAPWRYDFPGRFGSVRVSVSAIRRVAAVEIAGRIRSLTATGVKHLIDSLQPVGD